MRGGDDALFAADGGNGVVNGDVGGGAGGGAFLVAIQKKKLLLGYGNYGLFRPDI